MRKKQSSDYLRLVQRCSETRGGPPPPQTEVSRPPGWGAVSAWGVFWAGAAFIMVLGWLPSMLWWQSDPRDPVWLLIVMPVGFGVSAWITAAVVKILADGAHRNSPTTENRPRSEPSGQP